VRSIEDRIAEELGCAAAQVTAAVRLIDSGATVPFIARYRKEATGGLDDGQLRQLEERLAYLRALEDRRAVVLRSIGEQGKLTPELEREILDAETKTRLEDIYLPFRPKRRTKAQIAREAGLEPLALDLLAKPDLNPEHEALRYVDVEKGVADAAAALDGARQILMERFAEDPDLVRDLRARLWDGGTLRSRLVEGKAAEGAKFSDYFDFAEPIRKIPSHRALALFRGRNEGMLALDLALGEPDGDAACERTIAARFGIADRGLPADAWLRETVRWAWRVKIHTRLELELTSQLREAAEAEAIRVFARNLRDLLLAATAGERTILGIDPGIRTGVKVAVVDRTGRVLASGTIYPHPPRNDWDRSIAQLAALCRAHGVQLAGVGNGTASRETDALVSELIARHPDLRLQKALVSEAGASVYSASALAASELPDLDVSLRGAVSIARRLQDPLAELVKIEPKAIGVGQYQHDVNQAQLARSLDNVVEDCVNAVGVDLNTASPALLRRVSGLSASLADNIVRFREQNGGFRNRRELLKVPRLGDKTFEQAAGFLRIVNGDNPLDASAVHPEAYPVVERILRHSGRTIAAIIGDSATLRGLDPRTFVDERFGLPTVRDILAELEKPGRDPRGDFRTARFQDGVERLEDLKPGMVLEGVVTNVANFGAFVDVGVHQDGLVHVSAIADRFVKDPRDVVKAGDVVRVKVLEVDLTRRRIALTLRLTDVPAAVAAERRRPTAPPPGPRGPATREAAGQGAMAQALKAALRRK
jgi:uncharacterized protein